MFCSFSSFSQFKNEAELKKQAEKSFEEEDYATGFKLYSQLVANYPKDPSLNYHLGVCMLFSDPNKKKCMSYLQFSINHDKDVEKEAFFYLGKAYHYTFQFDEAMKYYNLYKQGASSSMQKKLLVDREIQCCKNGKRLLSNVQELVILDKKELSLSDYFRSYDLKDIGGKLLAKPADFTTPQDKKKKDKSIIYLSQSKEVLYYASYGVGDNKDIYVVQRAPNGEWTKAQNIGFPINTEYDEDFPFLHPNGKVLYFASKGHNSMGGYDIFKSEFDESNRKWKEPVNLDFPINSPNDDVLFVTDSLEKIAFLASTRQSAIGKTDVYKILTERRPAEFAFVKGTVLRKEASQSVRSKIKVKNIDTGEDEGTFTADENGEYAIKVSNGGKFIFTVETPGFSTQSEGVTIPTAFNYKPYKQAIEYEKQKLVITNFFETNDKDENNYAQYISLIEEKAKMNVNVSDFDINPNNPVATNKTTTETPNIKNNSETVATNTTTANTTKSNLNNKELVKMAYEDAKELQSNADSLKSDAAVAFKAANSKQDQANEKKQEAQDLLTKANAETNPEKKQELNKQAEQAKDEADLYTTQASTANSIAKQMEVDAGNKQKEADLNAQYAKALEEAEKTKNNKQAIAKLEELQKQLEEAAKQKSQTNNLVESIKADAQNKEKELQSAEEKQKKLDGIIAEFTDQYTDLDKQEKETKDKGLLENLKAQKEELTTDLNEKQKESKINQDKIAVLKDEADALKSQAEYASNILLGTASNNETSTVATNNNKTNTTVTPSNTLSTGGNEIDNTNKTSTAKENGFETKTKKYEEELLAINNSGNNLDNNKKKSAILNQYVAATNSEITTKKEELKKAKIPAEKARLNKEIKQLGEKKNELSTEIALVNSQIKEEEKQIAVAATNTTTTNVTPTNTTAVETNTVVTVETNTITTVETNTASVESSNTNSFVPSNTTTAVVENNNQPDTNTIAKNNKNNDPKLNSVNELLKNSPTNYTEEKKVFEQITYSDPKALLLKKQADDKFNTLQKNDLQLEKQLEQLQSQLSSGDNKTGSNKQLEEKSKKADELMSQAFKLRKEAKTMTGSDQQNALSKIAALEKEAADLNYEVAREQYQLDDKTFAANKVKIEQLSKKPSAELEQAKVLTQQADKIKLDASKLRNEAEKEPIKEAKTGALSNADEKEKEALAKQNEAITLLLKANPGFNTQVKNTDADKQIAEIKNKLSAEKQADNNALKLLADANKTEYTSALNAYIQEEKKTGTSFDAQEIKAKVDALHKEAELDLAKITTSKEEDEKRDLYLHANNKLGEAISQLRQAKQALTIETPVVTETLTPIYSKTVEVAGTNTTTTVGTSTTTVNNNTETNVTESNTVSPVATETTLATTVTESNTVTPIATNTTQTTNTISPVATGVLTETQIAEIKNTPEYQKVTSLKNNINKYSESANNDTEKAQEENMKAAKLSQEAANMPEGPAKQQKEQEAQTSKQKADSLQEMANNTSALANSKKQELEDYTQTLDKSTVNKIESVSYQPSTITNTSTTPANTNTASKKYEGYSPDFTKNALQLDEQLVSLQKQGAEPANLTKQNEVITDYIGNIDREVAEKKKQQAATSDQGEKTKIAQQIKTLQLEKVKLNNERSANENTLKSAGINSNVAANKQPNNNTTKNPNNNITPANNTQPKNTVVKNNTAKNNNNTPAAATEKYLANNGFEIKNGNAYSEKNPIPVDEKLPNGLFFRVQIGAFKNPIPADRFSGLAPVGAENTSFGFVRYQVGMFSKYQAANAVKNDMRKLKYNDAFVVAYYNGKRISLAEALDTLRKTGEDVTPNANSTAGISTNSNIPVNPEATANTAAPVKSDGDLNAFNGVFYTIQIGVYGNNVSATGLFNLSPVFKEIMPTGYNRYTAGIYSNFEKVNTDRTKVNALGIKDAFVSGYLNGKRVAVNEPLDKVMGDAQFLPERPIIFPGVNAVVTNNTPAVTNNNAPVTNVLPFNNGVTEGPAPTASNGVKTNEDGITFKVQIGAYRNQVPAGVADTWLKVKTWPIKYAQVNDLYLYTVGSFTEASFAKTLKAEIISLGITDAFVTVFKDGKKLYGAEAAQYLNR